MIYKTYAPSKSLQPYIAHYWVMESTNQDRKGNIFRFVPDGYVDWVFHFDSNWSYKIANSQALCKTSKFHAFGQLKSYLNLHQNTKKIINAKTTSEKIELTTNYLSKLLTNFSITSNRLYNLSASQTISSTLGSRKIEQNL